MPAELSTKLRQESISNAVVYLGGILLFSAATKYWLEKEKKVDKPRAFLATVGGYSIVSAVLFSLFSKERDLSSTVKDGLVFGLVPSAVGAALTETGTVVECSFWALSKGKDLVVAAGNGISDAIDHVIGPKK